MMIRAPFAIVLLLGVGAAVGDDKDPIKEKLSTAKQTYDEGMKQYSKSVEEWFEKREETARTAGNKKLVDQIKGERTAFEEDGTLPKMAPTALTQKATSVRKVLEAAYTAAIKECLKAKRDDDATAVEKELRDFRGKVFWKQLDTSKVIVKDDYFQIEPFAIVPTVRKYTGGVEIVVVARTGAEDIRLRAQRGSCVIFNWENNPRELRVARPDGNEERESGSVATAKVTPLKSNTWYTLKWRLSEEGTQVSVDGKIVFEEQKAYDLSESAPITVSAEKSAVDVKEFHVTPLKKSR